MLTPTAASKKFANRADLKAAVDSCLSKVDTGSNCCNSGADCGVAGTQEMPDWDVSLVTEMTDLFKDKTKFNADISNWDTSAVTKIDSMFSGATDFDQDITNWDTAAVTTMNSMFKGAQALNKAIKTGNMGNTNNWKTTAVLDMASMFEGAKAFNSYITNWDTAAVKTCPPCSRVRRFSTRTFPPGTRPM